MTLRDRIERAVEAALNETLADKVQEIIEETLEDLDVSDYVDIEAMVRDELRRSL